MKTNKFYDTSSLLLLSKITEPIIISSVTLQELESIKSHFRKDEQTKAAARHILREIYEHPDLVQVYFYYPAYLGIYLLENYELNNDIKILATALFCNDALDGITFYTNDMALYALAALYFDPEHIERICPTADTYKGFIEREFTEEEFIQLYQNLNSNTYGLLPNQYLIAKDANGNCDKLYWDGESLRHVTFGYFHSKTLGGVKPYQGDIYQTLAADSLLRNKITLLKGPAGTGKSYMAMGYLFHLLDNHKIEKIIIFCNTVATKGSARLGFLPGTRDQKLLDSQIGNFLASKLGDISAVERLVSDGKLVLLPMSDIRGYDTTGMNAGIYITEAQNLDINLMKLALQRIGEDSICIIDGDPKTQVDDDAFAGNNNGMRRVSEIFRGQDFYGEVELQNIYRSRIASIAENL